jgi:predicted rRNA methylase YqxC with S4 and FtsJ domains
LDKISSYVDGRGWGVQALCVSPISGADGNREFLIHFKPGSSGLEGPALDRMVEEAQE